MANGIAGSLSNPIVFYGVYDPLVGCTDPSACNFLVTAITDDGSCIYPGCDDPTPATIQSLPVLRQHVLHLS